MLFNYKLYYLFIFHFLYVLWCSMAICPLSAPMLKALRLYYFTADSVVFLFSFSFHYQHFFRKYRSVRQCNNRPKEYVSL